MKLITGVRNGEVVVLPEDVDLAPGTEVWLLIPEPGDRSLSSIVVRTKQRPPAEVLSDEEIVALVYGVRRRRRREGE